MLNTTPVHPTISPKMLETMQYHPIPKKPHERLRVTVKTNVKLPQGLSEIMEKLDELETDPVDAIPDIIRYNARLSYYTRGSKLKIFGGVQTMSGVESYYVGIRLRM